MFQFTLMVLVWKTKNVLVVERLVTKVLPTNKQLSNFLFWIFEIFSKLFFYLFFWLHFFSRAFSFSSSYSMFNFLFIFYFHYLVFFLLFKKHFKIFPRISSNLYILYFASWDNWQRGWALLYCFSFFFFFDKSSLLTSRRKWYFVRLTSETLEKINSL